MSVSETCLSKMSRDVWIHFHLSSRRNIGGHFSAQWHCWFWGRQLCCRRQCLPSVFSSFFSEIKRPIVIKLHISIDHDITLAIPVSFTGQGLSLTYLTCSVEYSQIYIYSLSLAQFLQDEKTYCNGTSHKHTS